MPPPLRMKQKNGMILPACQKRIFAKLVDGGASYPQFAMVVLLRLAACSTSLLIGLTSRCFVPQFAIVALLRYRLQVSFAHWTSASPVSRTARGEAPSPLGLLRAVSPTGRALRAPLAPPAALRPSIAHCALLRVLATSALRASDARKLVCSSPCLTGVFVPACASLARYSGAADALWACPRPSTPSGLRRAYYGLFPPQAAAFVRPSVGFAASIPQFSMVVPHLRTALR